MAKNFTEVETWTREIIECSECLDEIEQCGECYSEVGEGDTIYSDENCDMHICDHCMQKQKRWMESAEDE